MYNRQYFETRDFTVYGKFGIQYYDKDDRFDNDDIKKIVHKYDYNHVYGFIHDNGNVELYPKPKSGMQTMILHRKQFNRLYKAAYYGKDIRAKYLYNASYSIKFDKDTFTDYVYRIEYNAIDFCLQS